MARETMAQMMRNTTHVGRPKLIANNTVRYESRSADGGLEIRWRLHHTDVVVRSHNEACEPVYTLNSGGWQTLTTKDRINQYSPARVFSDRGVWYVANGGWDRDSRVPFYDGIRVNADGLPIDPPRIDPSDAVKSLKRKISKFCALVDTVDELPKPDSGDCWHCMMRTKSGETLGDSIGDTEHLMSHIDEGYLHGSLLVNAMRSRGYRDEQIGVHYHLNIRDTFKRALRHYLLTKLAPKA